MLSWFASPAPCALRLRLWLDDTSPVSARHRGNFILVCWHRWQRARRICAPVLRSAPSPQAYRALGEYEQRHVFHGGLIGDHAMILFAAERHLSEHVRYHHNRRTCRAVEYRNSSAMASWRGAHRRRVLHWAVMFPLTGRCAHPASLRSGPKALVLLVIPAVCSTFSGRSGTRRRKPRHLRLRFAVSIFVECRPSRTPDGYLAV